MRLLRKRPSAAMIVALAALFAALGSSALAGPAATAVKQLVNGNKTIKKGTLSGNRLQKRSVRGDRLANNTLTGAQIQESRLGPVPNATAADSAQTAATATSAETATTAATAENLAAPEAFHEVGAPGEPGFLNGCANTGSNFETVGFYKDRQGSVHLKGVYTCPSAASLAAFQLPAGYRPASEKTLTFVAPCSGSGCPSPATPAQLVAVYGSGFTPAADGAVLMFNAPTAGLDGITFRAAS